MPPEENKNESAETKPERPGEAPSTKPKGKSNTRIRALRRINVDGVHLEPKEEHHVTAERAESLGDLVEIIEGK